MHSIAQRLLSFSSFAVAAFALTSSARAGGSNLPPFDFSNEFYVENGIDPAQVVGRPTGVAPNSIIDNTPNGPDFNNVRLLQQTAAFDDSGHPIFFWVTGIILNTSAFLPNSAGQEAREIADEYKVYEFPRASNPPLSVFPKRQDLIADLSHGYFSNDPLGLWQVNIVRFTPAATNTPAGQSALADLAARNGLDLDGTPVVRTKSEVLNLQSQGFVTIEIPPVNGPALRWFFCPVIEDPRDGAIAPDAFLEVVETADGAPLAAEAEIVAAFHCYQTTGDDCDVDGASISTFCFGSSASACPCGNASAPGAQAGCSNSLGTGGRLVGNGTPRVGSDSVVLVGSQMPDSTALYFQGTSDAQSTFGDGLRCTGGTVVRLGVKANSGGTSRYPAAGDASISVRGNITAGATRTYQCWYRNADAAFCTSATFNLTNAARITWAQ